MRAFVFRHRWAVTLAVLQFTIFAVVSLSEHHRKLPNVDGEWFGCVYLSHTPSPLPETWAGTVDQAFCRPENRIKFVLLSNFPVILTWAALAEFTRAHFDQVWLFYLFNGFSIPVLWFGIGALIDRAINAKRRVANPSTSLK
jgi:hypothetical protein